MKLKQATERAETGRSEGGGRRSYSPSSVHLLTCSSAAISLFLCDVHRYIHPYPLWADGRQGRRQQRLRKPFRDASPSTSTSSYKSFPGRLTPSVDPSYSASPQITQFATFFPDSRFTKLFLWFLSSRFSSSLEISKFIQAPQPIGNAIRPVRLLVDILSQSRALFDKLDTTQPKCNYDK